MSRRSRRWLMMMVKSGNWLPRTYGYFARPQKSPTKVPTTIRFDTDVLAALKASGKGWLANPRQ